MVRGLPAALWYSVTEHPWASVRCLVVSSLCLYTAFMMGWTYWTVCTVSPGSASRGLAGYQEQRTGPGSARWWARRRACVASAAAPHASSTALPTSHATPRSKGGALTDTNSEPPLDAVSFRFCKKCPEVTLVDALLRLPPALRQQEKENRRARLARSQHASASDAPSSSDSAPPALFVDAEEEGRAEIAAWLGQDAANLVRPPKPERAHHCKVCKTCVLKYDHHCPWINQCVGLGNERYFILFMLWFAFGTALYTAGGWSLAVDVVWGSESWPYTLAPPVVFLIVFIMAAVMGLVVFILALWHIYLVAHGETSVESQDMAHYRTMAKERDQAFVNVYNLGWLRNLQLFFNVGPGMSYPYYTLLLPRRIEPYSDGWYWAKRSGHRGRHTGIAAEDEFTDDDGDE